MPSVVSVEVCRTAPRSRHVVHEIHVSGCSLSRVMQNPLGQASGAPAHIANSSPSATSAARKLSSGIQFISLSHEKLRGASKDRRT